MSDALRPQPKPGVMDIAAYVPGKSAAPAGVKLHKLSFNVLPYVVDIAIITDHGRIVQFVHVCVGGDDTHVQVVVQLNTIFIVRRRVVNGSVVLRIQKEGEVLVGTAGTEGHDDQTKR